jgi:hypothetical protein
MNRRTLAAVVLSCGALISGLSACGGGGSNPAAPTPSTAPNQTRTVLATVPFEIRAGGATFKSIDNPPNGSMDATLEWGNAASQVDFYATDGRCPGFPDLQAGRCTVLARAEGTGKPKRITFGSAAANGVINFWIYNRGTVTESGMMEVAVTTSGPVVITSPTPIPSTAPDPRSGLPAGPVTQAKIAIRSIDIGGFNYRDPAQDGDGNWVLHPGEFVVFDLSQRNGAGEKCVWIAPPAWTIDDERGILFVRGSSNPFLLRVDIQRNGYFEVQAEIDGISTNVLTINVKPQGN